MFFAIVFHVAICIVSGILMKSVESSKLSGLYFRLRCALLHTLKPSNDPRPFAKQHRFRLPASAWKRAGLLLPALLVFVFLLPAISKVYTI